jgi:hypothetical protein
MRLAECTVLQIMDSRPPISLRPSLRAAALLEQRHGFQKLFAACCDGNLCLMADIIEASSDSRNFLESIIDIPLIQVIPPLLESLPSFVLTLAGVDQDNKSDSQSGEPMPFIEYHAKLFRIGTGWLGWSPEVTWNATAAEITEAYNGHIEMLRAIHGGGEESESRSTDRPEDAVFDRVGLMHLKAMSGAA